MSIEIRDPPQFFLTSPAPCPYIKGRQERKVFTHLIGGRALHLNTLLTQGGFRRSQTVAYRPACEACQSCVSVRVKVEDFEWTRSFRRVIRLNKTIVSMICTPLPTAEQYSVFRAYVSARHATGDMADMTVFDFALMIEDTHVATRISEYRHSRTVGKDDSPARCKGTLLAVALTDILVDGLSMVYSFYEPGHEKRSLGTFMILDHIRQAREMGLPYVYLGYWVQGSQKMAYKAKFQPQERLGPNGWLQA